VLSFSPPDCEEREEPFTYKRGRWEDTDDSSHYLYALGSLTALTRLELANWKYNTEDIQPIRQLSGLENLQVRPSPAKISCLMKFESTDGTVVNHIKKCLSAGSPRSTRCGLVATCQHLCMYCYIVIVTCQYCYLL